MDFVSIHLVSEYTARQLIARHASSFEWPQSARLYAFRNQSAQFSCFHDAVYAAATTVDAKAL
jgi:hypothetical protein